MTDATQTTATGFDALRGLTVAAMLLVNNPYMTGQTIVVTGATNGVGLGTSRALAAAAREDAA